MRRWHSVARYALSSLNVVLATGAHDQAYQFAERGCSFSRRCGLSARKPLLGGSTNRGVRVAVGDESEGSGDAAVRLLSRRDLSDARILTLREQGVEVNARKLAA